MFLKYASPTDKADYRWNAFVDYIDLLHKLLHPRFDVERHTRSISPHMIARVGIKAR